MRSVMEMFHASRTPGNDSNRRNCRFPTADITESESLAVLPGPAMGLR